MAFANFANVTRRVGITCSLVVPFQRAYERRFCFFGLRIVVASWVEELQWAIQKLKGWTLISIVLGIAWKDFVYYI